MAAQKDTTQGTNGKRRGRPPRNGHANGHTNGSNGNSGRASALGLDAADMLDGSAAERSVTPPRGDAGDVDPIGGSRRELGAMQTVVDALSPLDDGARQRVLRWASEALELSMDY